VLHLVVKWFDLSRHEAAEVLQGVWPQFRELSEEVRLIDLTPRWFRAAYSPMKVLDEEDHELNSFQLESSHIPTQAHSFPQQTLQSSMQERSTSNPAYRGDIAPLMLWLAEKRIRQGMVEGLPVVRKWTLRTAVPLMFLYLIWKRFPRSRRPIAGMSIVLSILYVISVSRGLPASAEHLFKAVNFTFYRRRGERPFRTDQASGSLTAVLYALIEQFLPVVNTSHYVSRKMALPRSPAWSQASTQDHPVM
jgi:hypothetical protein